MNTRRQPARVPQSAGKFTLCINSAHRYQNKDFITNVFSHTCALLRPHPLYFHMLHKNTRGGIFPCFSKRRGDKPAPPTGATGRRAWRHGFHARLVGFVTSKAPAQEGGRYTDFEPSTGIRRRMPILSEPAATGESKDPSRHSPQATRFSLSSLFP